MSDFRDFDPRELRVPPSRSHGADPAKLQRQIALDRESIVSGFLTFSSRSAVMKGHHGGA